MKFSILTLVIGLLGAALLQPAVVVADSGLEKQANWSWPTAADLHRQAAEGFEQADGATSEISTDSLSAWSQSAEQKRGPELLESWLDLAAQSNPELADLVQRLSTSNSRTESLAVVRSFGELSGALRPHLEQNLRLVVGRFLAQNQLYDEAIEMLEPVAIDKVVDPSSLLFYRAVAMHNLLRRDDCLETLDTLLQREEELVSRFAVVSRLMKADIQPMEEDSLDEIARLMNDVKRRLDLERSGQIVRDEEDEIVKKLDKKIDEIEQQLQQMQQQQQQAQNQQPNNPQNAKPLEESQAMGGSGPGEVDRKNLGNSSGWGDLPPAQRQQALQNMTQDLPSHYREIIEAYFKQLASEP